MSLTAKKQPATQMPVDNFAGNSQATGDLLFCMAVRKTQNLALQISLSEIKTN